MIVQSADPSASQSLADQDLDHATDIMRFFANRGSMLAAQRLEEVSSVRHNLALHLCRSPPRTPSGSAPYGERLHSNTSYILTADQHVSPEQPGPGNAFASADTSIGPMPPADEEAALWHDISSIWSPFAGDNDAGLGLVSPMPDPIDGPQHGEDSFIFDDAFFTFTGKDVDDFAELGRHVFNFGA